MIMGIYVKEFFLSGFLHFSFLFDIIFCHSINTLHLIHEHMDTYASYISLQKQVVYYRYITTDVCYLLWKPAKKINLCNKMHLTSNKNILMISIF